MNESIIFRPFGPSMMKGSLSSDIVKLLDDTASEVLDSKELSKKLDWSHNLAGNVKKECRMPDNWLNSEQAQPFTLYLANQVKKYLEDPQVQACFADGKQPYEHITMTAAWVVSQWAGDFNPSHLHDGILSGVCYLRMPDLSEDMSKEDHYPSAARISWFCNQPSNLSLYKFEYLPQVGDFFLFPSWVPHTVYPFRTQNVERRSLSFNVYLK